MVMELTEKQRATIATMRKKADLVESLLHTTHASDRDRATAMLLCMSVGILTRDIQEGLAVGLFPYRINRLADTILAERYTEEELTEKLG